MHLWNILCAFSWDLDVISVNKSSFSHLHLTRRLISKEMEITTCTIVSAAGTKTHRKHIT